MVLKTFNVDEGTYSKFSHFCKSHGISMSKQVQIFMEAQVAKEPRVKQKYLEKLEKIRKGKFIHVENLAERYGLEE